MGTELNKTFPKNLQLNNDIKNQKIFVFLSKA